MAVLLVVLKAAQWAAVMAVETAVHSVALKVV